MFLDLLLTPAVITELPWTMTIQRRRRVAKPEAWVSGRSKLSAVGPACARSSSSQGDEPCETSYRDKQGKYQKQTGIVLPKL
jgi:hypothetical protein